VDEVVGSVLVVVGLMLVVVEVVGAELVEVVVGSVLVVVGMVLVVVEPAAGIVRVTSLEKPLWLL
jgi:hypothetical protein